MFRIYFALIGPFCLATDYCMTLSILSVQMLAYDLPEADDSGALEIFLALP